MKVMVLIFYVAGRCSCCISNLTRSSQAIGPLCDLLTKVDKDLHVKTPSGKHINPCVAKDFNLVLETLTQ